MIKKLSKEEFPGLLLEITDPPNEMYLEGKLPSPENKILCVVGSRKHTPYGKEVCQKLIEGLSGYPVTIVSGLALGIDSIAHRTAMSCNLQTIAVPGSGLNKSAIYPQTHVGLAQKIINSGGGLLSEFEPDFKATPWSFPKRNRIMAGLCHATLVIEAQIKSGTLITSRLAMEYNRDVLAVPGPIFSNNSEGTFDLIKNGATPIKDSEDILEALGIIKNQEGEEINLEDLSHDEQKIVLILQNESLTRKELISLTKLKDSDANIALGLLEIKGITFESKGLLHLQKKIF